MPRRPRRKGPSEEQVLPSHAYPQLLAGQTLPPAPLQARSRNAREALLAATLATFAERGYDAATIAEIGHRAGVAVGAFYQHFRSKRQALLVLMDGLLRELAALDAPLEGSDAKAAVTRLVCAAMRVDFAYLGAYRAWGEAKSRDDELAALHESIDAWTTARIAALLEAVRPDPRSRPDLDRAALARILNALLWRLTEMRAGEEAGILETVTAVVMHAIFIDDPN